MPPSVFDYQISAIHAALLQDGTVLTFGTLGVKEYHDDAINKKFNDPKITVGIKDSEYEIFLELAEKI